MIMLSSWRQYWSNLQVLGVKGLLVLLPLVVIKSLEASSQFAHLADAYVSCIVEIGFFAILLFSFDTYIAGSGRSAKLTKENMQVVSLVYTTLIYLVVDEIAGVTAPLSILLLFNSLQFWKARLIRDDSHKTLVLLLAAPGLFALVLISPQLLPCWLEQTVFCGKVIGLLTYLFFTFRIVTLLKGLSWLKASYMFIPDSYQVSSVVNSLLRIVDLVILKYVWGGDHFIDYFLIIKWISVISVLNGLQQIQFLPNQSHESLVGRVRFLGGVGGIMGALLVAFSGTYLGIYEIDDGLWGAVVLGVFCLTGSLLLGINGTLLLIEDDRIFRRTNLVFLILSILLYTSGLQTALLIGGYGMLFFLRNVVYFLRILQLGLKRTDILRAC